MSANSFGDLFRITSFGESHGRALGVIIDGCPSGMNLDRSNIMKELKRRAPGQSDLTTSRAEKDEVEIYSGVFEGKTLGTPIMLMTTNSDKRSEDYEHLKDIYRPGHADEVYDKKYGLRDWRGGGRSSARETWSRVAAGSIAQKFLYEACGMEFLAYVEQVGDIEADVDTLRLKRSDIDKNDLRCPDAEAAKKMKQLILKIKREGDSIGGVIKGVIKNVPLGLGEPVYDRLEAQLAKAMLSINAVKGFDIGAGFDSIKMKGSEHNNKFNTGGVLGGISTGDDIYFRVVFKPTATILKKQTAKTITGNTVHFKAHGRHDPCVLPRAVSIVDSMASIVMMNFYLRFRAYN